MLSSLRTSFDRDRDTEGFASVAETQMS